MRFHAVLFFILTTGAIGFDRIAAVAVACPGCIVGLVKSSMQTLSANTSDVTGRVGFNVAPVLAA